MFENLGSFFKKIMKNETKELVSDTAVNNNNPTNNASRDVAKERLHLVLMQDRANVSADFLELMKQEILDVIKKYIVVEEDSIDVRIENQENEDGTTGAPALCANIPILNIRNDNKSEKFKSENAAKNKVNSNDENKEKSPILEEKEIDLDNLDNSKDSIKKDLDSTQIIEIVNENTKTEESTNGAEVVESFADTEVIEKDKDKKEDGFISDGLDENPITGLEDNQDENSQENEEKQNQEIETKEVEENKNEEEISKEQEDEKNKEFDDTDLESIVSNLPDDIDTLSQSNDETDENDDDVTFDDLLKKAEEEEKLEKEEKPKETVAKKATKKTVKKTTAKKTTTKKATAKKKTTKK